MALERKSAEEIAHLFGQGRERKIWSGGWMTCCPAHDDGHPSLKVEDGTKTVVFHCYAGCDNLDILAKLRELGASPSSTSSDGPSRPPPRIAPWAGPADPDRTPSAREIDLPPGAVETARWAWRERDGRIAYWSLRLRFPEGFKIYQPYSLRRGDDDVVRWTALASPSPRPLYNLPADDGVKPIVFTEGEKTADAAARVFGSPWWVTTAGPSTGLSQHDLSPLVGRDILIAPDFDSPGLLLVSALASQGFFRRLRVLLPPKEYHQNAPSGLDLADLVYRQGASAIAEAIASDPKNWIFDYHALPSDVYPR